MSLWSRLRALPAEDRRLLAEALVRVLRVRVALRFLPFASVRRRLDAAASHGATPRPPERVGWAVAAVARRLPGTTCLAQSLAALALLRRRGYRPELLIGVRPERSTAVPLDAHAWVVCDGQVVAGSLGDLAEYRQLRPVQPHAGGRDTGTA